MAAMTFFQVAVTAIAAVLLEEEAEEEEQRRRRRFWVHPVIANREQRGQFRAIYHDLRAHEDKFLNYTRMSIKSFDVLLGLLSSKLQRQNTSFRDSIPPVERLIITLRYLATGHSIASLHFQFLIGKSTASYIIRDTCSVIWEVLKEVVFPKPETDEWARIADLFWQRCNFPNCVGAIDGKHIRIQKPVASGSSFYNYKKYFSFVLFAMADANYRFVYVDIGSYGRSSDSSIFAHSTLGHLMLQNRLGLPDNSPLPGTSGPAMPYVFVADEAFALGEHLLRPYSSHALNTERRVFNYRLTRARRVVECAFGILANKWRLLHSPIYLKMQHAIQAIKATCALHNFIREHDGFQFEDTLGNPAMTRAELRSSRGSSSGAAIRDTFCSYFQSPEGLLPWQLDAIA